MRVHAESLRQRLAAPIYNPILKRNVGDGTLDYERYLRTVELLSLQLPGDALVAPEELMFQVVHQTQELWLKLVAQETAGVIEALDHGEMWRASELLARCGRILTVLTGSMAVLETMTPDAYQVIRRSLGSGSGQESPGYNAVRLAAEELSAAFDRVLEREGLTLAALYEERCPAPDAKRIAEQLLDYDEGFQGWLVAHFQLVRRTIGVNRSVRALDGVSTQVLPARMTQPLFPRLWDVRLELTAAWSRDGGYAPGAERTR